MNALGVFSFGKRLLGFGRPKVDRPRRRRATSFKLELLEGRSMFANFSIQLTNQTGLDPTQFAIYALGFSSTSQMELKANGTFGSIADTSGHIKSYKVGFGSGELSEITLSQDQNLVGALVYFFVVPLPNSAPYLTYSGSGTNVTQPQNPPANTLPDGQGSYIYQFIEFTQPLNGLPTVDVSVVDGFIMPVNVTLSDGTQNPGLQIGQPVYASGVTPVVNREAVFTAYTNFINANVSSPTLQQAYLDLIASSSTVDGQPLGIVNPGIHLNSGAHSSSPLNTVFDTTLTALFTTPGRLVGLIGDDGAYYQGTPTQIGSDWVLQFVGYTDAACTVPNGNTFNIYSPLTPDPLGSYQTNETSGEMVFANDGVFADTSSNVLISGPAYVALGLQRDIVAALNRGVALLGPTDGLGGDSSAYWSTETNWYPAGQTFNVFSWFMHVGQIGGQNIFVVPTSTPGTIPPVPATDAQGNPMGQAYGFAYDETPAHPAPQAPFTNYANVPSKFDPVPAGTKTISITFGPWTSTAPPTPGDTQYVAVGSGAGTKATVKVYTTDGSGELVRVKTLKPFGDFKGGVRVATGDVNGDGTENIIVGQGPKGQTRVKVYDGTDFSMLYSFKAFPAHGAQHKHIGTFVASADVNNDGLDDIVVGADTGWLPLVNVFSGMDGSRIDGFLPFSRHFKGGVRVAAGDLNKDGFSEIVVGGGRGSRVKAFDGSTHAQLLSFNAYQGMPNRDGVFVAIGNVQGDDILDIVTGTGPKTPVEVRVFDGTNGDYVDQVLEDRDLRVGIPVGVYDWDNDGTDDVLTGVAKDRKGWVDVWKYNGTTHRWLRQDRLIAFDAKHGDWVG